MKVIQGHTQVISQMFFLYNDMGFHWRVIILEWSPLLTLSPSRRSVTCEQLRQLVSSEIHGTIWLFSHQQIPQTFYWNTSEIMNAFMIFFISYYVHGLKLHTYKKIDILKRLVNKYKKYHPFTHTILNCT